MFLYLVSVVGYLQLFIGDSFESFINALLVLVLKMINWQEYKHLMMQCVVSYDLQVS